jgi:hypothetical protein
MRTEWTLVYYTKFSCTLWLPSRAPLRNATCGDLMVRSHGSHHARHGPHQAQHIGADPRRARPPPCAVAAPTPAAPTAHAEGGTGKGE